MTNIPHWVEPSVAEIYEAVAADSGGRLVIAASPDADGVALLTLRDEIPLLWSYVDDADTILVFGPRPSDATHSWVRDTDIATHQWQIEASALTRPEDRDEARRLIGNRMLFLLAREGLGPLSDLGDQDDTADDRPAAQATGRISVSLRAVDVISFARAYNGRPLVLALDVTAPDGDALADVAIQIEASSLGEQLTTPWRREIDVLPTTGISWRADAFEDFRLEAGAILRRSERVHGEITVTVTSAGQIVASASQPVDFLAPDSWVAGHPLAEHVTDLAAFVQPQEPALAPILRRADELLRPHPRYSGLSGYQTVGESSDFGYVDAMVAALFTATHELGIAYAEPPASWALKDATVGGGQRVRLPGQVITERVGTCLDTSVLFAAVLLEAGLYPVIMITPGHAVVAYWRDEKWHRHPLTFALAQRRNVVDSGILVPLETTVLTRPAGTFAAALAEGSDNVVTASQTADLRDAANSLAVDVVRAHSTGTLPLPVRTAAADGTVTVVEYAPQRLTLDMLDSTIGSGRAAVAPATPDEIPRRVQRWMDSLLDLSLRNPLLNYRFPQASSVSLMVPNGFIGRIEDLLQAGTSLRLEPNTLTLGGRPAQLSSRHTLPDAAAHFATDALVGSQTLLTTWPDDGFVLRMRRVMSMARSVIDETGSNQLFLALGMVSWLPTGRLDPSSAPLALLPVTITSRNRSREFSLEIDVSGQVTPNFSLVERLRTEFGLSLPKLLEPESDGSGIDVDGLVRYVREEFERAGLSEFGVDESCTLGFFDFSTYRLWRDLRENWALFEQNSPLVRHLVRTPTDAFHDPVPAPTDAVDIDAFAAALPVAADGSQARAVHDAIAGRTFVLQGPPGTGKSQTITNLLASALQAGRRVLFVAEKPDALAVVRDRLAKIGLDSFGLNLHDKGMSSADVRRQITDALGTIAAPDETGYAAAQREVDRTIAPLRRYPDALHAQSRLGVSAYAARDRLLALPADGKAATVPARFVATTTPDAIERVRAQLIEVNGAASVSGAARENPWSASHGTSGILTPESRERLRGIVMRVAAARTALDAHPAAMQVLSDASTLDAFLAAAPLAFRVPHLPTVDAAESPAGSAARANALHSLDSFSTERMFPGADPRLVNAPVGALRADAEKAASSFFIGRKGRVAAVADQVRQFVGPEARLDAADLVTTIDAIAATQNSVGQFTTFLATVPGVTLPSPANILDPALQATVRGQLEVIAADLTVAADDGTPGHRLVRDLVALGAPAAQAAGSLASAVRDLLGTIGATPTSTSLWLAGRSAWAAIDRSVPLWTEDADLRDFMRLRRWLALRDILARVEADGLPELSDEIASGTIPAYVADIAFERGLMDAILRSQIDAEGLDTFLGSTHDAVIAGHARATATMRSLTPEILASRLLEGRGFGTGVTTGAVGELRRELAKQRRFKPIRRLLHDHWAVISRAAPLVLATPDSLVRFVDAEGEPFDLIVFDEASQIRTAHAIGVLGRGRTAIVVGDDKQMPPTSVAQVRQQDDEDEDDIEQESILSECVQALVPEIKLTWHYRSEDESLIAFSNHEYYGNSLSTLPSPGLGVQDKGLSFVRVDGTFVRGGRSTGDDIGTNRTEAEAIVAYIVRRLKDPLTAQHSIGVVTFNRPQQRLVQRLLMETEDPLVLAAIDRTQTDEAVTVWNLETVQGSERDVMLFSIAFSKDSAGRMSRNFGPLNNIGGQRRLNVAVTRARRQLIVFASFDPEDLRSDGLAEGLQHLERFLRIARDGFGSDGAISTRSVTAPDRHREQVAEALRHRGMRVATNVGLSDFTVDIAVAENAPSDRFTAAVLTDGPAWRRRATIGDRDTLPRTLLADRMGWPVVTRVWTPDWLRDVDGVADDIVALVRAAESAPVVPVQLVSPRPDEASSPLAAPETHEVPATDATLRSAGAPAFAKHAVPHADVPVWREWTPPTGLKTNALDKLALRTVQEKMRGLALELLRSEGPARADHVAKSLARAHGLGRVHATRLAALRSVLDPAFTLSDDDFYFPLNSDPDAYPIWSRAGDPARPIDDVSLVELSTGMQAIARVSLGITRDDLIPAAAEAFGAARLTAGIRSRLSAAVDRGIARGVLQEAGGYITAE